MQTNHLENSLVYLKGVGPKKSELISKELGITTYAQLLSHFPFRYIDRTQFYKIREIKEDIALVQIIGRISSKEIIGDKHKKRLVIRFGDDTGSMELIWFQGVQWAFDNLHIGKTYIAFGRPSLFQHSYSISHPEMESYPRTSNLVGNASLQPVYSSTEKLKKAFLDSKGIQKIVQHVLELHGHEIPENIPEYIRAKYKLCNRREAFSSIHFPKNAQALKQAQRRLKFEELFFIQLEMWHQKLQREKKFKGLVFTEVGERLKRFYQEMLPFDLTNAQKRVIKEIRLDTQRGIQMNRLVQGDVGSGKTIVALMSMLLAVDNSAQACMMAPTEILAQQHFDSIQSLIKDDLVSVALLTGNTKKKDRTRILLALEAGEIDILIGTHALIEDRVKFANVGLVVIDEQHRFGVDQRAKLWQKNAIPPHILVMTATPIPRTLAMTLYGDLDVSVIDELPVGRKPIDTKHLVEGQRLRLIGFMRQEIAKGRQVYVVYPLISENEKLDLLNLESGVEQLRYHFPLPNYQISIVHGKMKNQEKNYEMNLFITGKTQIMVATTVIEVGVNVPNASVMVIENAERFGLSQLHQLRGRVGRGAEQSFCILMSGEKLNPVSKQRIQTMVKSNNGFEIAEIDLSLRGPGDISGTQQSGVLELKMANLATDQAILQEARKTVIELFENDPDLEHPDHLKLKSYLARRARIISYEKIS